MATVSEPTPAPIAEPISDSDSLPTASPTAAHAKSAKDKKGTVKSKNVNKGDSPPGGFQSKEKRRHKLVSTPV